MNTLEAASTFRQRQPLISLIVAVYNQRYFAPLVLSSIAAQVVDAPFEVLFCDDGSSDDVLHTVATWASREPAVDVRYIWQPDRGFHLSRSKNNGIRVAQGQIIVFADGDEWLAPFFLQDHWDAHQVKGRLVCGPVIELTLDDDISAGDNPAFLQHATLGVNKDQEGRIIHLNSDRPWLACTGGNFSVQKSDVLMFDEDFEGWGSEDRDLAYRLYSKGLKLHLIARTGIVHLRNRTETTKWNPTLGGTHSSIVAALRGKLLLYRKYPGELMLPSIALVRHCHLNPITDKWSIGPPRTDVSECEILEEFASWLQNH